MAKRSTDSQQAPGGSRPTLVTPPEAPVTAPRRGRPPRRAAPSDIEDELEARRLHKAHQKAMVARWVEDRIDALECEETYAVSRLFVLIAGSLGPGHLLSLIARWSDKSLAETGTPWISRPVQEWINHSGLPEDDWIEARDILREQGLIEERRRFDLEADEIVVEIAFVHKAFAQRVAALREEVREDAWQRLRQGGEL